MNPYIPDTAYYVLALVVSDGYHGRGTGARLLRNSIEKAREGGFREVHLDALSDNPAVQFYRAMGFACMAETTGSIEETWSPKHHLNSVWTTLQFFAVT